MCYSSCKESKYYCFRQIKHWCFVDGLFTNYDFCITKNDTIQHLPVSTHCGLCRVSWSLSLGAGCGLDVWRISGVCCVSGRREVSVSVIESIRLLWDVLASSISSRRSYSSTTFFRFMLDRCSIPLLLYGRQEKRTVDHYLHDQEEQSDRWEGGICEITTVCSGTWGVEYVRAASADGRAGWTAAETTGPFWRCSKPERQSQSPAASEPSHDSPHLQESVTSLNSYLLISTKQDEIWCW